MTGSAGKGRSHALRFRLKLTKYLDLSTQFYNLSHGPHNTVKVLSNVKAILREYFKTPKLPYLSFICKCHGYLFPMHLHVVGWSLQRGACLWNDACWVQYILLEMSLGFVDS